MAQEKTALTTNVTKAISLKINDTVITNEPVNSSFVITDREKTLEKELFNVEQIVTAQNLTISILLQDISEQRKDYSAQQVIMNQTDYKNTILTYTSISIGVLTFLIGLIASYFFGESIVKRVLKALNLIPSEGLGKNRQLMKTKSGKIIARTTLTHTTDSFLVKEQEKETSKNDDLSKGVNLKKDAD